MSEALLRQQPANRSLSQREKRIQAEHEVNKRVLNSMSEHGVKERQRRIEFLERAEQSRGQGKSDKALIPEADRQKLKDAYRRAADRRRPQGKDHGRDR